MASNITPNVDTGQFDLKYDPNILSVASVADGNIGGTAVPMSGGWNVITSGVPDGKYILRVVIVQTTAASGSGYFCQITFNATAAGTSALEFVADEGNPQGDLQLIQGGFPVVYLAVTWISGNVTVQ
jgi:hypothetical protein